MVTYLLVKRLGLLDGVVEAAGVGVVEGALGAGDGDEVGDNASNEGGGNLVNVSDAIALLFLPIYGSSWGCTSCTRDRPHWSRAHPELRLGSAEGDSTYRVVGQVPGEVEAEERHFGWY